MNAGREAAPISQGPVEISSAGHTRRPRHHLSERRPHKGLVRMTISDPGGIYSRMLDAIRDPREARSEAVRRLIREAYRLQRAGKSGSACSEAE